MHVLTKIFVVLVALLAIMLVPLVLVYAKNESNYKAMYLNADAMRASAIQQAERATQTLSSETQKLQNRITSLQDQLGDLQQEVSEKNARVAQLQADLATSKQNQTAIAGKISTIASRLDAGQSLIEELVTRNSQLRETALAAERSSAELEARLREQSRSLEVAESAVRSLQEEVQRLSEANARSLESLGRYVRAYGQLDRGTVSAGVTGPAIDRKVVANVVDVRSSSGGTLAEIDAGSRDGVKEGWVLTLGDGNGNYVGTLRIVEVDLNRATGVAETAFGDPAPVALGHRAVAFPAN